jgi:hypothetical protein
MTQSDLSCTNSDIPPRSPHYKNQLTESSDIEQSGDRNPMLGLFVILVTALVFYGSISVFIIKFL